MDNEKQLAKQTPVASASLPEKTPNLSRSMLPLIFGGILLIIFVGGGAYYLGMQHNKDGKVIQQKAQSTQIIPTSPASSNISILDESKSPNGLKVIKQIINNSRIESPWEYVVLTDSNGGNGIQLVEMRDSEVTLSEFGEDNWNRSGQYVFITSEDEAQEDVYIFKIDGQPFSDGRYYFTASEVGYPKTAFHSKPYWSSANELVIIPKTENLHELYVLNAEKKSIKKGPSGSP